MHVVGKAALFCCLGLLWSFIAHAGLASFSYQGQIIQPNGMALEASSVQFTVEVRSPAPNSCVLYRERHARNMAASNGIFALQVGDGTRPGSADPADSISLTDALNKSAGAMTGLTCASGNSYTPDVNDEYELRIMFNDGSGVQVVAQNHKLRSVPYAMSAQSLNGVEASQLLQINTDAGQVLDQANLESVFTSANYTELMALLGGTSSQYLSAAPGAPFSMNSQRITDLADPTGATDAANKNYVDSYIGGSVANGAVLSTLGAGQAGQVLTWDGNEWTVSTPTMVDATKLPLAGGTMAGAIDMNSNNISERRLDCFWLCVDHWSCQCGYQLKCEWKLHPDG
jgi:trimeric autotransporter adhesin